MWSLLRRCCRSLIEIEPGVALLSYDRLRVGCPLGKSERWCQSQGLGYDGGTDFVFAVRARVGLARQKTDDGGAPGLAAAGLITPAPQRYAGLHGGAAVDLRGWSVAGSASVGALPLRQLAAATGGAAAAAAAPGGAKSISLGLPHEDAALAALAASRGVALRPEAGREGYVLQVEPSGVVLLAHGPAGGFYGVQSLLQLVAGGAIAPSCRPPAAWTTGRTSPSEARTWAQARS